MVTIVYGDIFESDADVICHQVNCKGKMGSGVAKQVREKYPLVYSLYHKLCEDNPGDKLLGTVLCCGNIANLFAQENYGYDGKCYTDYEALRQCLSIVNERYAGQKVAIPYLMGCHRGGGDWGVVLEMIQSELTDCDVTLYNYNGG